MNMYISVFIHILSLALSNTHICKKKKKKGPRLSKTILQSYKDKITETNTFLSSNPRQNKYENIMKLQ